MSRTICNMFSLSCMQILQAHEWIDLIVHRRIREVRAMKSPTKNHQRRPKHSYQLVCHDLESRIELNAPTLLEPLSYWITNGSRDTASAERQCACFSAARLVIGRWTVCLPEPVRQQQLGVGQEAGGGCMPAPVRRWRPTRAQPGADRHGPALSLTAHITRT